MVRNDSQCTQLIICKLDHLWYATGKDQTNLFFSFLFFFSVQVKNQLHALDSFDLATGVPQMIQFTYDTLSPLLSRPYKITK